MRGLFSNHEVWQTRSPLSDTQREEAGGEEKTRAYYDAFAERYDDKRGGNVSGGYHDLIDDLEVEFIRRFAEGKDLLEVGCGTGLLLERFARFARRAEGVDLSDGMIERARARGLSVRVASATDIPFADGSFDVTCALKVLPHVRDIEKAAAEMFRVTKPGGTVVLEVYNPWSLRALTKKLFAPRKTSTTYDESAILTRFDSPDDVARWVPQGATRIAARGVRIVTPVASIFEVPVLGAVARTAEQALCDGPLSRFGGFYLIAYRK